MWTPVGLGTTVDALVLGQPVDTAEGLAAVVAIEGQVACVHALVLEQLLAIEEIRAARLACEGLLGGVQLLVPEEEGVGGEGAPALLTIEGLLTAVHTQVLTEARVLLKPLSTLLTLKGHCLFLQLLPLLCRGVFQGPTGARLGLSGHMAFPVLIEFGHPPEDPPAVTTLPPLLLIVNPLMLHKEHFQAKGVPTLFTCKVVFYGQILWAASSALRVTILFDLSGGVTGPGGAHGCHLLCLSFFTHHLVAGRRGVLRVLSLICAVGWV